MKMRINFKRKKEVIGRGKEEIYEQLWVTTKPFFYRRCAF